MMLSDRDIRARLIYNCPDFRCSCKHMDCMDEACVNDRIWITPEVADDCIQPHSVDLTLSPILKVEGPTWDVKGIFAEPSWEEVDIRDYTLGSPARPDRDGQYPLMPGQFLLASTVEKVFIPHDLAGHIHGKSSIGRRGVAVHITAGLVDAGFEGEVTLEMTNNSSYVFWLKPGMKICQITFEQLTSPAEHPYGHPAVNSHYQGQSGPTVSVL